MLGKLLKYEFKATARLFLPIYAVMIVMALGQGLFSNPNLMNVRGILIGIFVALVIGLFVFTIVIIIQRFNKNLLGDEGYLTFTLPVSVKKIVTSKLIAAIIYCVISVVVSIVSFLIIAFSFSQGNEILYVFREFMLILKDDRLSFILLVILVGIISTICFISLVYLSISMGQIQKFNNHRVVTGFFTYFILNFIRGGVESFVQYIMTDSVSFENFTYTNTAGVKFSSGMVYITIIEILFAIVFFLGTTYILEKKLNLE